MPDLSLRIVAEGTPSMTVFEYIVQSADASQPDEQVASAAGISTSPFKDIRATSGYCTKLRTIAHSEVVHGNAKVASGICIHIEVQLSDVNVNREDSA